MPEMAEEEGKRPDKIDFAVIVTPNNSHYDIAKVFWKMEQCHVRKP